MALRERSEGVIMVGHVREVFKSNMIGTLRCHIGNAVSKNGYTLAWRDRAAH